MKKRGKMMLIFILIVMALIVMFILLDGTFIKKDYKRLWEVSYSKSFDSIQKKIIAGALTASSSHNLQPWLIKIVDDSKIELYADMEKILPVIDKDNRQLLISQGTFIEKYREYALAYGYETTVLYKEGNMNDNRLHIAELSIEKKYEPKQVDIITSATYNYVEGEEKRKIESELETLSKQYETLDYEMISVEDDAVIQSLLRKAYAVESRNEAAMKELLDKFRFTEWEKEKYRYGLSLNSLPALLLPFVQPIMKMTASNWEGFGQSSIKTFEGRLNREFAYIIIKAEKPERLDFVKTGEFFQALTASVKGYTLRPSVQIIEDFEDMNELKTEFKQRYSPNKEIILIVGIKESKKINNPSIRHLVEDIILQ